MEEKNLSGDKKFLSWCSPIDIFAIFLLVSGMILIGSGVNHVVSGIVIMVVSFYFGQHSKIKI